MAVVTRRHFIFRLDFSDAREALFVAKTVIGFALCNEFFRIFFIEIEALALHVRPVRTAFIAALVPVDAEPCHRIVQILNKFFVVARTVGIFESQNKFAALRTRKKIIEQRGANTADMLHPRRRWSVANTYFVFHNESIIAE